MGFARQVKPHVRAGNRIGQVWRLLCQQSTRISACPNFLRVNGECLRPVRLTLDDTEFRLEASMPSFTVSPCVRLAFAASGYECRMDQRACGCRPEAPCLTCQTCEI